MSRTTIRRVAALPLSLAVLGIVLIALAALPANDSEKAVAHAPTTPTAADIDHD